MTLPSSGTISINDVRVEKGLSGGDYSLQSLSTTGINSSSPSKPDGIAPHQLSEFYSYNHTFSTTTTTTTLSTTTSTTASPIDYGQLWVWGDNYVGQLGLNYIAAEFGESSPIQLGSDSTWKIISSDEITATAIKNDGTLWVWGENTKGQHGQNDTIDRSSPVQVGTGTDWEYVEAAPKATYAIKTNGTLWVWGDNAQGQLGQNDLVIRSSPVQLGTDTDWAQISSDGTCAAAIKTNGTLWTWGANSSVGRDGVLGHNDTVSRSSPVQVGTDTNWSYIEAGGGTIGDIFLGIKTDGTLWSWGNNNYGQLGQNIASTVDRSSPVQIGTGTDWYDVAAGSGYVLATKTNGTLWAWGRNDQGQLGQNDTVYRSSPVQVGTQTNWNYAIAGPYFSGLAIKTNGTLWAWGYNEGGYLAQNDTIDRSSPVQIGADTNWIYITPTMAIKTA